MTTLTLEQKWIVACNDLLTWEEETDRLLPAGMTAELIADLEEQGVVVDLETGQAFDELTMMAVNLAQLRLTEDDWLQPFTRLTPEQMEELEAERDEAIGEDFSTRPFYY